MHTGTEYVAARGCSPNTVVSYAYDLLHLWRFLAQRSLEWSEIRPTTSLELLEFLRAEPAQLRVQRFGLATVDATGSPRLAPATVNRILTGVAAFYEWAIVAGLFEGRHPIERRPDPAWRRVTDRHRPFAGRASRQRPERRTLGPPAGSPPPAAIWLAGRRASGRAVLPPGAGDGVAHAPRWPPAGKTFTERMIPLNDEAADAIRQVQALLARTP